MARRCFISFKTEDIEYKEYIQTHLDVDMIDCSLDEAVVSTNEDYIMRVIREQYLHDSTVTIHLIGAYSSESRGDQEQRFIKRELQASLFHGEGNTQNGILGVVLPTMTQQIYGGSGQCFTCGRTFNYVRINDTSVVREFSFNYYLPATTGTHKCSWSEEERYCVLVPWNDFVSSPETYIEQAYQKRTTPLAEKTIVRP